MMVINQPTRSTADSWLTVDKYQITIRDFACVFAKDGENHPS